MQKSLVLPPEFQTGPFAVRDAIAHGISPHQLRSPSLSAPFVGVRSLTELKSRPDRALALGLRLREGQAISGLAAAELWGLPLPPHAHSKHTHLDVLTRSSVSRVRIAGVKSRRIRDDLFRAVTFHGIPVVSPVLAVLTSAPYLEAHDVAVMMDALLTGSDVYRGLKFEGRPHLLPEQLPDMLNKYERMHGLKILRTACDVARPGSESPMESFLRLKMMRFDLPGPVIQPIVRFGNGVEFRPDLGYPDSNTYINYDGEFHFTDNPTRDKDLLRDRYFQEANYRLFHVVNTDLNGERWTRLVRNIWNSLARGKS